VQSARTVETAVRALQEILKDGSVCSDLHRRKRVKQMNKPLITRIWLIGLIGLAVGLIAGGVGVWLMLAFGGSYTPSTSGNGYEFAPTLNAFFWTTIAVMVMGFALAVAGAVTQFVAWIGALINTYHLEDKLWFYVLLGGGALGIVSGLIPFATMIAYLIAAPDGSVAPSPRDIVPPTSLSVPAVNT
jgi:magnesium-transporting ATPase (P-type)